MTTRLLRVIADHIESTAFGMVRTEGFGKLKMSSRNDRRHRGAK